MHQIIAAMNEATYRKAQLAALVARINRTMAKLDKRYHAQDTLAQLDRAKGKV